MNNEESKLHFFKKDYEYLNDLIKSWYRSLQKEKYCLAISRKAPRLLDWCQSEYGGECRPTVISELALPFMKSSDDYKGETCAVVDEAIYHGTTFRKVLALTENVFDNIKAMPLVFSVEAMLSKDIRAYLHRRDVIDSSQCPFFINTIISKFLTLGKPYDIEYPLFYIELPTSITKDKMGKYLERLVRIESAERGLEPASTYYATDIYSREAKQYYTSFTYLSEYLYTRKSGRSKPDFSKLRFFYKENRLCVVSMSPHVLSESDMDKFNPMLTGDLEKVWALIYGDAHALEEEKNEFNYQIKKSLVVMTNYLLSFANFLQLKDSLLKAFQVEEKTFSLDIKDLTYLVGPDLGKKLMSELEKHLHGTFRLALEVKPTLLSSEVVYSQIPLDYRKAYAVNMGANNLYVSAETVEPMLSNMFSAMHWAIEIPSRRNSQESYNRLRFGESYRSIGERFSFYYKDKVKMRSEIHQAMDARIDSGSAVPNYIRKEGTFSDSYWIRMFRSGENEDFRKDQILRQLITVFNTFLRYNKGSILHQYEFEFILTLLAYRENEANAYQTKKNYLFGAPLTVRFCGEMYKTYIRLSHKESVSLVDYAMKYHILALDEFQFLRLDDNDYVQSLSNGSIWTQEQDKMVDSYSEYVYTFTQKNAYPLLIREVINYLYYKDKENNFLDDFVSWKQGLKETITTGSPVRIEDMSVNFLDLLNRLPEPYLRLVEEKWDTANTYIDQIKVLLATKIKEYKTELLDDSTFYKLMLSYYVLNLWSYYKNDVIAHNFNIEKYEDCLSFVQQKRSDLKDWLDEAGSMSQIKLASETDVKAHLGELLGQC